MESTRRRVTKNLVFSVMGQIITIAIGLILPRMFLLAYGSEVNGLVNSVNQLLVYLSLFEAGIGMVSVQALYAPIVRKDKAEVNGIISASHIYYKKAGRWYFFGLIALCVIYPLIVKAEVDYCTIASVLFWSGIGNAIDFYFRGKYNALLLADGKKYIIANLSTISTVLIGLTKATLIQRGHNVVVILVVAFGLQMLQTICIIWHVKREYPWVSLEAEPNHSSLAQKNYVLIHQIATLVFHNTDILLLTIMCDLKIVSVYAMYKLIITQLENILYMFSGAFEFALGQSYNKSPMQYKRKIDAFESIFSIAAFTMFSVCMNLMTPFLRLYTRGLTDINYCDPYLVALFVSVALLTAVREPMRLTIYFAGHFKDTTMQTIIETVLNLTISIIGCIYLGIYGVLLGTVGALLYRTFDMIMYSNVKLLNRKPWKTISIHSVSLAIMVIAQIIYRAVAPECNDYLSFFKIGIVDVVFTAGTLFLVQCVLYDDFRNHVAIIIKNTILRSKSKLRSALRKKCKNEVS